MRKQHRHWPFLCLCAQVASKQGVYPSTCRLDESIMVAVSLQTYDSWHTNDADAKNPQTLRLLQKTSILTPDCMMFRRIWKENELQIPDCMIVRNVSLNWKPCSCCNFRTSSSGLHDCQRLEFGRKSKSNSWLLACQRLDPEMKNEHQLPDRMLVRSLVLAWNWSNISWLDIPEESPGPTEYLVMT